MFIRKADYEEEVRKDDENFWRTTNDPPPVPKYAPVLAGVRPPPGGQREKELPSSSAFEPLPRENKYNLWLDKAPETDFFKAPRK